MAASGDFRFQATYATPKHNNGREQRHDQFWDARSSSEKLFISIIAFETELMFSSEDDGLRKATIEAGYFRGVSAHREALPATTYT
jgi:hypothetical protein